MRRTCVTTPRCEAFIILMHVVIFIRARIRSLTILQILILIYMLLISMALAVGCGGRQEGKEA